MSKILCIQSDWKAQASTDCQETWAQPGMGVCQDCYHDLGNTAPWTWGVICLQIGQGHKGEISFLYDLKIYCPSLSMYKNHMSVTAPNIEINLSFCKTCRSGKDMSDHTFCFSCKTVCFIWWNSLQEAQHVPSFATFSDFSGNPAERKQFPL